MKQLLSIILILCYSIGMGQTKTVPKNGAGEWYYRGVPFPANPGDTILLQGDYTYIEINDLNGLPGKPIVFIKTGQRSKVGYLTNGNSMIIQRCSYLVIDGVEVGNDVDGKFNEQGFNIQSSHNIEIRNSIIKNSKIGLFTNPASGHYPNIYFHHNTIKNIGDALKQNFDEAIYIGKTDGTSPTVASFPNLRIEDNEFTNIGGDAIQIANGVNVSVKRNRISNYGQNKINDQWFGILCGGGTSGTFEDNVLTNGSGTPFQILGTGLVTFRNNTAINTGTGATNQDAFYIRQSFPTLTVRLIGNKVDVKSRNWITEVTPGLVIENTNNQFGGTITDTVIITPPTGQTVPKAQYDSLLVQYNSVLSSLSVANATTTAMQAKLNSAVIFADGIIKELQYWKTLVQ